MLRRALLLAVTSTSWPANTMMMGEDFKWEGPVTWECADHIYGGLFKHISIFSCTVLNAIFASNAEAVIHKWVFKLLRLFCRVTRFEAPRFLPIFIVSNTIACRQYSLRRQRLERIENKKTAQFFSHFFETQLTVALQFDSLQILNIFGSDSVIFSKVFSTAIKKSLHLSACCISLGGVI